MRRAARRIMGVAIAIAWIVAAAAVPAQGNYQVQPGDTLSVEVMEDSSLNRSVLVTPDGRISVPMAGTVAAGGRTLSQIERAIESALAPNFAVSPNVFVAVTGIPPDEDGVGSEESGAFVVYVVGEVNDPGPKAVLPGTTVLQLLSQSGGFTPFAATKRIQLRQADPHTGAERLFTFNYRALSRGARIQNQPGLREGDVLLVPERRLFE
ncbi:MAG: polysaccharide biosynthesis/export family protein [Pseudomonadota bacterium]